MKAVLFCFGCAFVLYELSGLIGKGMLADKHIHGRGEGYQNIVFGKESKKSLIVNIQYNIFAPVIFMLLIAAALQYWKMTELLERVVFVVPCYYIVRGFMITVVSSKRQLYNISYECMMAAVGCIFAFFVQYTLILSGKNILPSVEEFRTQLWLVFFALAYNFLVKTFGRSPGIRQNRVCTEQMKQKYILDKYDEMKRKYDLVVKDFAPGKYLSKVIYSIMIYENFNRTRTQRWGENLLFLLGKRPMTLGIMQVKTTTFISNIRSVELGCEKIRQSFREYIEQARKENGGYFCFGGEEPETCLKKICEDYNGAEDYGTAILYIFYLLPERQEWYDLEEELPGMTEQKEEPVATSVQCVEAYGLQDLAEQIGTCPRMVLKNECGLFLLDISSPFAFCAPAEVGTSFLIQDVEDLVLEGQDGGFSFGAGDMLWFKNCKNITIQKLKFTRRMEEGAEKEAVLRFENCSNLCLELVEMDGVALQLGNCSAVSMEGATVQNCTQGVILVKKSELSIDKSFVLNNQSGDLGVVDMQSSRVEIANAILKENQANGSLLRNDNSILKCENVFVHACEYRELCNQKVEQGIIWQDE